MMRYGAIGLATIVFLGLAFAAGTRWNSKTSPTPAASAADSSSASSTVVAQPSSLTASKNFVSSYQSVNTVSIPSSTPAQMKVNVSTKNNFELETECASYAREYLAENGFSGANGYILGQNLSYQSHYNSELGKCFILLTGNPSVSVQLPDGIVPGAGWVDVYDAVDGSSYASFSGFVPCGTAGSMSCRMNSGAIWLRGTSNIAANPNICLGQSCQPTLYGDQNTYSTFMTDVDKYFMTN